jgi:hypothetical protein
MKAGCLLTKNYTEMRLEFQAKRSCQPSGVTRRGLMFDTHLQFPYTPPVKRHSRNQKGIEQSPRIFDLCGWASPILNVHSPWERVGVCF